jgi:hypothetical protein
MLDRNEQEWQKNEAIKKNETGIDLILAPKFKLKTSLASSGLQPQNFRGPSITL